MLKISKFPDISSIRIIQRGIEVTEVTGETIDDSSSSTRTITFAASTQRQHFGNKMSN